MALAAFALGCTWAAGCATTHSDRPAPGSYQAVVDASDRSEADRKTDGYRKPADFLAFIGVRPGWKIADLGAGAGYSTELVVRAAGSAGVVYAQNSPKMMAEFFDNKWGERFDLPLMKSVIRVNREFDEPLPPEAKELDAVVLALFYHDTVWMKTDRKKMNQSVFKALRSGGVYVVIDHSAKIGTGVEAASDLHRIEQTVVRSEIEAAGFRPAEESNFLRNPTDPRDFNVVDDGREGQSDRFALRFVKP